MTQNKLIQAEYVAFNGHVFSAYDAKTYNETFCATPDERHNLFCNIIYQGK